ncbi:MAG: TonB-dependent receptor [Rhodocyclaceae bacterium]|jgi:iron complex outermembrane receptor protein|nr:TonB-dependent receptor [Rhodocyclaceae bacterium]
MSFKRVALATAISALPHVVSAAEGAGSAAPATLKDVVVSAKTEGFQAAAGEGVGAATVQTLRAVTSDTASLLRDVPGVSLYGAGGVSSLPSIHGLADDRLRIKVDGMDLIASCPNHMNPALSYLDPSNVGALKVYAGLSPVSVGGDSIGGTVLAETPPPVFAAAGQGRLFKGEAGAFYRSNGNGVGGNVSATYATESFSATYSGATAQADNYDAGGKFKTTTVTGRVGHSLALDEVGSTAYETRNHTLGVALKGGNHLLEARLGYQDMPYQLYPNQRMDLLDNSQHSLNLRYRGQFDWGALEARVYHEKVEHFMDFGADKRFWYGSNSGAGVACSPIRFMGDPAGTCAGGMPMYTEGKTTGAVLKADIALSQRDLLRLGGEYQRYRLDDWWPASGGGMGPGSFENIKDGQRDRLALFGEWESQLNAQWLTSLGLRHERVSSDAGDVRGYRITAGAPGNQLVDSAAFNAKDHERSDNNWDLAALARYTASTTLDIEFGFTRKVRSPNLYERYTWSTWAMAATMNNFVGDGNGYVGNLELEPEKAHTLSATFDWHGADRSWEFKATPYYTRVSDYIDAVKTGTFTADKFNVLTYANQSARLYGLDLSGHLPLARTAWGEWGFKGLLNYTHGKNRETGDDLYNVMPLNARLTLTHKLGGWDNGIELVAVQGKDAVSDVRNEIKTPGYSLTHLRASYAWQQARVDFGVENLFDKAYYLPLGGAYLGQGTTMSMNGVPWGIAVPGMGRSLYAGLNVKF